MFAIAILLFILSLPILFERRETGFQIAYNIVYMLGAYRQADRVLVDVLFFKLLVVQLRVGSRRRMDDERLNVGDVCEQREDLERVDELPRRLSPALYIEGEDRSAARREVLFIQIVLWMIGERGMVHPFNERMRSEEFDDFLGVLGVSFETERKRFYPLKKQGTS